ncbi:MAG: HAD-IA family hydrolase [Coriobacteriia bacterium]|nr:HAD-IA family hydrolase [Coriobacteriia bacterium]
MLESGTARVPRSASEIRAVLFDLDGTLVDTVALILASMRHATHTVLGYTPPDEVLMQGVGVPLATQMHAFSVEHAEELVRTYRAHNWEIHDELIAEYPGAEDVLGELAARGMPMGVVTSKSRSVATRGIERFELQRYLRVVVCADDTTRHKPEPDPLVRAAGLLGVPLDECAYVGDSPYDMQAALAGGAIAVAALWGAFAPHAVLGPRPHFALRFLGDILPLLDGEEQRFRIGSDAVPPL